MAGYDLIMRLVFLIPQFRSAFLDLLYRVLVPVDQ